MAETAPQTNKPGTLHKSPLFSLMAYHHRAIELRYEGKTYQEIMERLMIEFKRGFHVDSIRKWFGKGGLLLEEYMVYAGGENDRRRQYMREELKKLVGKIPVKLDKLLDSKDEKVQLHAVKLLVEILGISINDLPNTNSDKLAEYFKRLEAVPMPGEQFSHSA